MTDIGDLSVILIGTQYEDAIPCIQATFDAAGIKTIHDLDNAPKKLTFCVCDFETYPLLSEVRALTLNPPTPEASQPAAKASPKKAKAKQEEPPEAVVETEPEADPEPVVEKDQGEKE